MVATRDWDITMYNKLKIWTNDESIQVIRRMTPCLPARQRRTGQDFQTLHWPGDWHITNITSWITGTADGSTWHWKGDSPAQRAPAHMPVTSTSSDQAVQWCQQPEVDQCILHRYPSLRMFKDFFSFFFSSTSPQINHSSLSDSPISPKIDKSVTPVWLHLSNDKSVTPVWLPHLSKDKPVTPVWLPHLYKDK